MKWLHILLISSIFCVAPSCRDEYMPDLDRSERNVLVVEGFLNAGQEPTFIRLTRNLPLTEEANLGVRPEINATVTVEGTDNSVQSLSQDPSGLYTATLTLQDDLGYRVRIITTRNEEYLSEFVEVKPSPPIDSIGWTRDENGVIVHANTHDDTGGSVYYRWEYDETWEINSTYYTNYIFENLEVRLRRMPEEDRSVCFKYGTSRNVIVGSSARLQSDRIEQAPLLRIPPADERLSVRYSIMVRQYVLDKKGYEFFDLMKKNTEQIGTIFDPQPSELSGNFTCISNPQIPVIGYINAGTIAEKRFFIRSSEIPNWNFYVHCPIKEVTPDSVIYYLSDGTYIPYAIHSTIPGTIDYYLTSYPRCVDCTERNGSLQRPSYW